MENIFIKNDNLHSDLDRKIYLNNGSLIIQKQNDEIIGVYLVISFRDNKNRYRCDTKNYCTLINLDNGQIAFEEHCNRVTTERRVLRHITRAGFSMLYNPESTEQDYKFKDMRIQVYNNGNYKLELDLLEEQILGGKREKEIRR